MKASRFDDMTRLLARRLSRRSALGGVAGLVGLATASAALPAGAQDDPDAQAGSGICLDLTRCKRNIWSRTSAQWQLVDIGPIPGGTYTTKWDWGEFPPCVPEKVTHQYLSQLCNDAYPGPANWHCNNECMGCPFLSVIGC